MDKSGSGFETIASWLRAARTLQGADWVELDRDEINMLAHLIQNAHWTQGQKATDSVYVFRCTLATIAILWPFTHQLCAKRYTGPIGRCTGLGHVI